MGSKVYCVRHGWVDEDEPGVHDDHYWESGEPLQAPAIPSTTEMVGELEFDRDAAAGADDAEV